MKTRNNKNTLKNRRQTIKGGIASNTKAHIIVTKSKLDDKHQNLLYKLIIEGPTLTFLDYLNHNMDLVDEGLLVIKSKDESVKKDDDIVHINTIEYGNKITPNISAQLSAQRAAKRAAQRATRKTSQITKD